MSDFHTLKFEYDGETHDLSVPLLEDGTSAVSHFGLVNNVITIMNLGYVYSLQKVLIVKMNGEEVEIDRDNFDEMPVLDEIEKLVVYPRERDSDGNVMPSSFVDAFSRQERINMDTNYARTLNNQSFEPSNPFADMAHILGSQSVNLFNPETDSSNNGNDMVINALSNFIRSIQDYQNQGDSDSDDDDDDLSELETDDDDDRAPFTSWARYDPETGQSTIYRSRDSANTAGLLRTVLMRMLNTTGPNLEDIKIVCKEEDLGACPRVAWRDMSDDLKNMDACPICQCDYTDEDEDILHLSSCSHYFHYECIVPWLTTESNKCPICREPCGLGTPNTEIQEQNDNDAGLEI